MIGIAALVFALGLRHGFDPDHLVAIDGLTRSGSAVRARRSGWAGLFFSLGHGLVVTLVALAVALAASSWQAPRWLETAGAAISAAVLLALGTANALLAMRTPAGAPVPLAGLRSGWLAGQLARASHPLLIAAIGAAFAVSFDTISYAVLFSLAGAQSAGWVLAAVLGLVFTLGMAVTDALNSLWVAHLAGRADRRAAIASRWMSFAIAALCFALAAAGFAKYVLPALAARYDENAAAVSVATLAVVFLSYVLGGRLAGRRSSRAC